MSSAPKARLAALSEQLVNPPKPSDFGTFENINRIPKIAKDDVGPSVAGKVIIVTGANSPQGIGRATVHQFARNGAKAIYICDYQTDYLDVHKRELKSLYPDVEIHTRKVDAGEEADVAGVVDEAVNKYGRLDVVFANAGISITQGRILESSAEDFVKVMRTNALGVFLATKHAARGMLHTSPSKPHPGGSIIATASVAGLRSNAGATDYSASKAAVISIMQTVAYQMAGTGIRCNAICPGIIETGMTSIMYEMARQRGSERKIGQLNPLQRGGLADEVARVVAFLGSESASYVNGQAWAVDGGLSAGLPFVPGKIA
ncbi:hypothetical protein B0A48_09791 [Cryoendolithus antarcticus]|uniref:3-oxoacyl-[acyl-carrier-protein] reductase FabG n=1 Tax=Cryoendolithus antarcticus TaxID=1507870 RepID=A0A1V8T3A4_9PEZI|nr:hypothetical protein B0A48_09791 [Cryoendolithus antarcticus]OQO20946.1 hypothetical protein B0A51_11458 [Rachicladosporium sp. CCFEE 5018]